jgi:hypothetical protein
MKARRGSHQDQNLVRPAFVFDQHKEARARPDALGPLILDLAIIFPTVAVTCGSRSLAADQPEIGFL